jgi:ATP adenylyltransferase
VTDQNDELLKRIWAPWRLDYVKAIHDDQDAECIFCVPPETDRDRQRHVVVRRPDCVAILNRYPYNNGHLLIAPARHVATLRELADDELAALMRLVRDSIALLEQALGPQGFNVVPRWVGDTNVRPATSGTKVMPQSLDALWDLLRQEMQDQD